MNPLKAPPSLLHGFGVPTVGNSNSSLLLGNNSNKKRSVSAISQTPKARTVSLGGEADLFLKTPTTPSQASGDALLLPSASEAALLLSFSSIAENEVKAMGKKPILWKDDEATDELAGFPKLPLFSSGSIGPTSYSRRPSTTSVRTNKKSSWWNMGPRLSPLQLASESDSSSSSSEEEDDGAQENSSDSSYVERSYKRYKTYHQYSSKKDQKNKRTRTVSIDSPAPESPVMTFSAGGGAGPNLVSPLSTPVLVKAAGRKCFTGSKKSSGTLSSKRSSKAKRERRPSHKAAAARKAANYGTTTGTSSAHDDDKKRSLKAVTVPKGKTLKTILRKKFSWKNYPEVSLFLRLCMCVF